MRCPHILLIYIYFLCNIETSWGRCPKLSKFVQEEKNKKQDLDVHRTMCNGKTGPPSYDKAKTRKMDEKGSKNVFLGMMLLRVLIQF